MGRGVGPIGMETADDGTNHEPTSATATPADSADGAGPTDVPGGLMVSADGYTLDLGQTTGTTRSGTARSGGMRDPCSCGRLYYYPA